MIVNPTVAKRYAEALFASARDCDQIDRALADFRMVAGLAEANPMFAAVLANAAITAATKNVLFDHLFTDAVSPLMRSFLSVLVRRRREGVLVDVYREFTKLVDEARGVVDVAVVSAAPLADDIAVALNGRLNDLLGLSARMKVSTDPDLIGGLVVRVGDQEFDGSVRTRLSRMRARLAGSPSAQRR